MIGQYNRKSVERAFEVGDEVLILLPLSGQPFKANYQEHYTVARKVDSLDYIINTSGRKKTQKCQASMIKLYQTRVNEKLISLAQSH